MAAQQGGDLVQQRPGEGLDEQGSEAYAGEDAEGGEGGGGAAG